MNFFQRLVESVEGIHFELEALRTLKEHELGVRLEYPAEGHPRYVVKTEQRGEESE